MFYARLTSSFSKKKNTSENNSILKFLTTAWSSCPSEKTQNSLKKFTWKVNNGKKQTNIIFFAKYEMCEEWTLNEWDDHWKKKQNTAKKCMKMKILYEWKLSFVELKNYELFKSCEFSDNFNNFYLDIWNASYFKF
jgi:hypothetical protein